MKKAFNMKTVIGKNKHLIINYDDDVSEVEDNEEDCNCGCSDSESSSEDENLNAEDRVVDLKNDLTALGWSPCLAHSVQLVVNSSIKKSKEVNQVVKNVVNTVHVFKKSPKTMAVYRKEVNDACTCSPKTTHELLKPNTTRWNSTFFAMERFCKVSLVFETIVTFQFVLTINLF